jgi:glyoxalase family protein
LFGVLFEVATAGPRFTIDEPAAHLDEALKLPSQYEEDREHIEKTYRQYLLILTSTNNNA